MSNKWSKKKPNPGTPKICKIPPKPPPPIIPPIIPPWPLPSIDVHIILDWIDGMMGPKHIDEWIACPWDVPTLTYRGDTGDGENWRLIMVRPQQGPSTQVVSIEGAKDWSYFLAGPTTFPMTWGVATHYLVSAFDPVTPSDLTTSAEYDM